MGLLVVEWSEAIERISKGAALWMISCALLMGNRGEKARELKVRYALPMKLFPVPWDRWIQFHCRDSSRMKVDGELVSGTRHLQGHSAEAFETSTPPHALANKGIFPVYSIKFVVIIVPNRHPYTSFTNPTSITLSVGTLRFAIFVLVLLRIHKKTSNNTFLRMPVFLTCSSSFPMM